MNLSSRNLLLGLGLALLAALPAAAAPTLKLEVGVSDRVVTVGDMFDDAGALASQPLFLAPAPGTSGMVSTDAIRIAAGRAGLEDFDDHGATEVRVSRLATTVDQSTISQLLSDNLKSRGVLTEGMTADVLFDTRIGTLEAAAVADPVTLQDLRYSPDSGIFAARLQLAGADAPLDVTGRIDLMVQAPELTATLAAGTILSASDVVMQPVPAKFADNGNIATLDQLVGKQLLRQSRAGMVVKTTDIADPQLIARSDLVTVYLHSGRMTLTVKGTALNAASLGQTVAVLNLVSKKVVHGIARADGSVEITAMPVSVAGL